MAMTTSELLALNDRIAHALMRHIEPIFRPGVKITLLARTPGNSEADVLVSSEGDLQDAMDLIARSMSRNVIGHDANGVTAAAQKALAALESIVDLDGMTQGGPQAVTALRDVLGVDQPDGSRR